MKKYLLIVLIALIVALPVRADGCTYFDENNTHDWIFGRIEADCEYDGENYRECAVCGLRETLDIIPGGHEWVEKEVIAEPSCTADGERIMECTVCGTLKNETIPASGHSYGEWETTKSPTCNDEGQRSAVCLVCGQKIYESISRTAHNYGSWTITKEPTDNSMGRRSRRCEECGATNEEAFYPDGTLYRGMKKNEAVQEMQQKLIDIGILADKADGIFGKNTEQAVRDYQELAGLDITGIAYPETLNSLETYWDALAQGNEGYYSQNGFPESCMHALNEEGLPVRYFCKKHFDSERLSNNTEITLEENFILWRSDLNNLYDDLINDAEDDKITEMIMSRKAFYEYLDSQETIWTEMYNGNKDEVLRRKIDAVIEQLIDLCYYKQN